MPFVSKMIFAALVLALVQTAMAEDLKKSEQSEPPVASSGVEVQITTAQFPVMSPPGASFDDSKLRVWACEIGVSDRELDLALKESHQRYIGFADFSLRATDPRLKIYDRLTGRFTVHHVSQGIGSSESNIKFSGFREAPGSQGTPGGVLRVSAKVYEGSSNGRIQYLEGLEPKNANSGLGEKRQGRRLAFGWCNRTSRAMDHNVLARSEGSLCLPKGEARRVGDRMRGAVLINFESLKSREKRDCHLSVTDKVDAAPAVVPERADPPVIKSGRD